MKLQPWNDRPRAQAGSWIYGEARIFASIMLCACLGLSAKLLAQAPAGKTLPKDAPMTLHAAGAFDAKTTPLPADGAPEGTNISRYAIDKQYHGDLEGTSKGEMLGAGDPAKGNAGYVAIERVNGTLHGRSGSFALQHSGMMEQGKFQLTVTVVPGSGAGGFAGIAGTMTIIITNGKHAYTFDYTLPEKSE
ncbi:MAG: DUF3224 domain-containing protein [Terriglobales bacterium]